MHFTGVVKEEFANITDIGFLVNDSAFGSADDDNDLTEWVGMGAWMPFGTAPPPSGKQELHGVRQAKVNIRQIDQLPPLSDKLIGIIVHTLAYIRVYNEILRRRQRAMQTLVGPIVLVDV